MLSSLFVAYLRYARADAVRLLKRVRSLKCENPPRASLNLAACLSLFSMSKQLLCGRTISLSACDITLAKPGLSTFMFSHISRPVSPGSREPRVLNWAILAGANFAGARLRIVQ
ncbi:hypothetical protein Q8A67_023170 [Cirrhinus molitorella]|uniref:Uncharacterized protein n=1 Tax=Cirrhinus molitorella TaxID=172907 RepID=A0AA88P5K8_9TELE|nr:hypothetical protein Q8A67_023170 [Cirrhinus molitorella]